MARRKLIHWVSTGDTAVTTVGAVATNAVTFDLSSTTESPDGIASDNCCINVDANFLAYSTAGTANLMLTRQVQGGFRRVAGTITLIDALIPTLIADDAAIAGSLTAIDISGNLLRARVTGVAAITIDWFCDMRIRIYQPA